MSERPIDIWRRKLQHLQAAEAQASDPAQQFTVREQIQEAQRNIVALEADLLRDYSNTRLAEWDRTWTEPADAGQPVYSVPPELELSKQQPRFELTLSNFERYEFHDQYLRAIDEVLKRHFSWSSPRARMATFVINELVSNAFEHGCKAFGDEFVSLMLHASDGGRRLVIRVKDAGPGFSLSDTLANAADLDGDTPRGRGLTVIKTLASELIASADGNEIQASILRDLKTTRSPTGGRHFQISETDGVVVARLVHEKILDAQVVNAVISDGLGILEESKRLVIDMSQVEWMSSHFLGFFPMARAEANRLNHRLCYAEISPKIQEVFRITRLSNAMNIFDIVSQAVAWARQETVD